MIARPSFISSLKPFVSLYASVFFLLTGLGLLNTFLSLKLTAAGVGVQTTGMVMTVYFIGLTMGTFYCGRIVRSVGHIRAFVAFAAVGTAMVMIHGLYLSVPVWMVLRFVCGFSNIGMFMVIESWLNACADPGARGRIFSIYMIMTYLGGTIGQTMLGLADVNGPSLFFVVGVFIVLSIVPVAVTRSSHPKLPRREGIRFCRVCRRAPMGMTGSFVSGVLISAFYAMAPVFAHQIHLTVDQISWFMAVSVLGGLLCQWPVGMLSDRIDRTLILPWIGLILAAVSSFIMVSGPGHLNRLILSAAIFGGFLFTIYPVAVARAHDMFEPEDVVKVSSALLLAYGIGSVIGPVSVSVVMDLSGTPYGFYLFFIGGSLLFVALSVLWRSLEVVEIIPPEDQVDFVIMKQTSRVASHLDPRLETEEDGTNTPDGEHITPEFQRSLVSR